MKKLIALVLSLVCVLGLVGCSASKHEKTTESFDALIADSEVSEEVPHDEMLPDSVQDKELNKSILTITGNMIFNEESFQITGETAQELLSLLNCLSYDKNTCDGIPEYIITCPDQSKYYLNLSSAWAWNDNDKESDLSDDTISAIYNLIQNESAEHHTEPKLDVSDKLTVDTITDIAEPNLTMLTLKDLVERDGEKLTWTDFVSYYCEDISNDLFILRYPINNDYYLLIGGESMEQLPIYIRLVSEHDTNNYIDVRTDNIGDFIATD